MTRRTLGSSVLFFVDDDAGFVRWRSKHEDGFVVNGHREPSASYLVLHRTACHTISGSPANGASWTALYAKACAPMAEALDAWARGTTGALPARCGLCHPPGASG